MSRYRFHARDASGQPASGEREAPSPSDLITELVRAGYSDVVVRLMDADKPTHSPTRLSADDTRELAQQIAGLARAGMPLHSGLRALADDLPPGQLREVVAELAGKLDAGEPLDGALEAMGDRFPGHLRDLLLAGVGSGHVGEVLSQFVDYARVGAELKRSVWTSLLYPLLIVCLFLALFVMICVFVVRQFESIYLDFGITLPILTRILIDLARLFQGAGWSLLITPLVTLALGYLAWRFLLEASTRQRIANALPIIGPLFRWTSLAQFSHYLAMLLECQIPLGRALPLAGEGTGDALLRQGSVKVAAWVDSGEPLHEAVGRVPVLPSAFRKLLRWAEGYQSLPETLHMIGDMFEAQARSRAVFAAGFLGILAVIFILWGVTFLVVALFMPMISLISRLSG
jgi:general secretion pathway protein F